MKRTPRADMTTTEAARVGEELREARLSLGASVEDMAQRLKINRRYIHALEEGRVKDLPGAAYAVGFVRSYAAALGLDADEAVRRFRDVTGGAAAKPGELVFPEPVPSRGVPAGAVVALGVAIAIGAYVAWFNWSGSGNRVVDTVPPVPARLDRMASEAAPREETPPRREAVAPPPAGAAVAGAAAPPPAASPPPPAASPAPPAASPAPPAAPPAAPAPRDPEEPRLLLRARGESWVQVRDTRSNQVLLDRVLRAGDTWPVPNREGLVLTTGKAENLDILVDGEASPAIAGATGVRRGIALSPERLRPGPEAPGQAPPRTGTAPQAAPPRP